MTREEKNIILIEFFKKLKESKTKPLFNINEHLIILKKYYEFKCLCGNNFKQRIKFFKDLPKCKECLKEIIPDKKNKIMQRLLKALNDSKCKIISVIEKDFISIKESKKINKFECKCGNVFEKSIVGFISSPRCRKCFGKEVSLEKNTKFKRLKESLKKSKCKALFKIKETITPEEEKRIYKFQCKCNTVFKKSIFKFNIAPRCRECSNKLLSINLIKLNRKTPFNEILEKAKLDKLTIITKKTEYEKFNNLSMLKLKCDCGNNFLRSIGNFKKGGGTCRKCCFEKLRKNGLLPFIELNKRLKQIKCSIDLCKQQYEQKLSSDKLKIFCSCGNILERRKNELNFKIKIIKNSCYCKLEKANIGSIFESNVKFFIEQLINKEKLIYNSRKYIKPYELDIFIPELNKAIECNGDYFHMNPKIYQENDINKKINRTAKDIWNKDEKKNLIAKSKGISIFTIWESDWNNNQNEVKLLLSKFLKS